MSDFCCIFVCGNKSHKEKEMKKRVFISHTFDEILSENELNM